MNNLKTQLANIQKRLHLKYGSFSDEYIEQQLCLEYIHKDDVVLEIGGNIGRVSLIISSIIDSSNLVVVESDPDTCKYLRENRNNNNLQFIVVGGAISNVNLYQCGWNVYTFEESLLAFRQECKNAIVDPFPFVPVIWIVLFIFF